MLTIREKSEIPEIKESVVTVGSFDGVHLGHCRILDFLKQEAARTGRVSVVVTFDPHPRRVLGRGDGFFTINPLEENLELIAARGIDIAFVQKFDTEFSKRTYQDFVKETVIDRLHARTLVMGPNHAVGHNRSGSHAKIKEFCMEHGLEVVEIPEETLNDSGVHSAEIRRLIMAGKWDEADTLLGYKYKHRNK